LDEGRAGTLVAPGDPHALAAAIASVLARPAELARKLDYASARAHAQYSVTRMQDTIGAVIERLQAGAAA
jgi:hypothetical protein